MIITFLLYLLSFIFFTIFSIANSIASGWSVWPDSLLSGLTYFFSQLMIFNFLFPIDTLFTVILFIINFEVIYLGVKILLKLFNFIRGASGIEI